MKGAAARRRYAARSRAQGTVAWLLDGGALTRKGERARRQEALWRRRTSLRAPWPAAIDRCCCCLCGVEQERERKEVKT
jgi:hypothetical protein